MKAKLTGRARPWARSLVPVTVFVCVTVLATACNGGSPAPVSTAFAGATAPTGSWPYPNGDLANTRVAPDSAISAANVSSLREAWTFKLTGPAAAGVSGTGSLTAPPVVADGLVYLQDEDANVYALALATGKLKWQYQVNVPEKSGPGPDGVAVADGAVYGDSSTSVFALNAATGKTIWVDSNLLSSDQGAFEIQPQVADGRIYLASAYGSGNGGGVLMALNASTGRLLWKFNTVIGVAAGVQALGLGSGGAWETPLVGSDGSVTFGIGNPYQSIGEAIAHPSRQLYTDSEVNLDAATGKLRWYYQAVPNDFMDHDLQSSPISASIGGVPVIIAGGKVGYVYALNARSGALLWKTPVGEHNGHDNDSRLALSHQLKVKFPYTVEPGSLGGILSNMAVADGSVYVATIDLPITYTSLSSVDGNEAGGPETGEVEALSLATGKVEWDTKVPELPLGAATVSNDLLFTTLYHGVLIALNLSTGAIVYRHQLPTSTNAPIAVFGNTVLVPAGGPKTSASGGGGSPQLVAYTVPLRARAARSQPSNSAATMRSSRAEAAPDRGMCCDPGMDFDAYERRLWAGRATAYQRGFARLTAHTAGPLLDAAGVEAETRLLDVGTGPGVVAKAAVARGARVTAVDAEPSMAEAAAHNVPGLDVRVAVLPDLPLLDGEFDAITGNFVINAMGEPEAALAELARVLREGGRLALTCWDYPPPPVLGIAAEAIEAAGVPWPDDIPVPPFRIFSSPGAFEALLDGTGFVEAAARRLNWEYRVDPGQWWEEVYLSDVGSTGVVVGRQDAATVARIKTEYDRLIARYAVDEHTVALPAVAVLASAIR
jgi:outer membrane protein assembly factor BamB/SAM-dependent methyltransferase